MSEIQLGEYVRDATDRQEPVLTCQPASVFCHLGRPWVQANLEAQVGGFVSSKAKQFHTGVATVSESEWVHTLLVGQTGSGKSRAIDIVCNQRLQQGDSAVIIARKFSAVRSTVVLARQAGLSPDQVTIVSPDLDYVPGWRLLGGGDSIGNQVSDIAALIEWISPTTGPRMMNITVHGLTIIGVHGLSLYEFARFLQREDYRDRLLARPLPRSISLQDAHAYREAHQFFRHEFTLWAKSERANAVAPILTRVSEIIRSRFLLALLCPGRSTVDLSTLWQRQQVLIYHIDTAALGNSGAKLVSGLVALFLFRAAMRSSGSRKVLCVLDELASLEGLVGRQIVEILTVARSQNLRLVTGFQFLSQVGEELRKALLSQSSVQLFFRLAYEDSRIVASSLCAGASSLVTRATITADPKDSLIAISDRPQRRHAILSASGQPIRLSPRAWATFRARDMLTGDNLRPLYSLAERSGMHRLYVKDPMTGQAVEIRRYVQGLRPSEFWLTGPAPLQLTVAFPKLKVSAVERLGEHDLAGLWSKRLQNLEVQHALLRIPGQPPSVIKLRTFPEPVMSDGDKAFLAACLRANGQSQAEIEAMLERRAADVDGGYTATAEDGEVYDDGSLA